MKQRGFSRREWMAGLAGTAGGLLLARHWERCPPITGTADPKLEDASPTSPLHPSLARLVPLQDGELAFDPLFSSLDSLEVEVLWEPAMVVMSFTPAGLKAYFVSDHAATMARDLGLESGWVAALQSKGQEWNSPFADPALQMEAGRALVRRARDLVRQDRDRAEPARLNPLTLCLARRLERTGMLARFHTSPFRPSLYFIGPRLFGSWWNEELCFEGTWSAETRRIAEHVTANGARRTRRNCYHPVPFDALIEAVESLPSPA
jgi:hypothetical protein